MVRIKYYKIEDGKKVYYFDNKLVGNEYQAVTKTVNEEQISYTLARKRVAKIKVFKEDKNNLKGDIADANV